MKKKIKTLNRKIAKTNKAVQMFLQQTLKNYQNMKKKCKAIWLATIAAMMALSSCNVTRKTTVESTYFQKGDTSTTITVKTVETYDATKKGI